MEDTMVPRVDEPADIGSLFNPFDPAQLEDPYPIYALARRQQPVFYSERLGVWVITRHADLCAVLRDPAFSSAGSLEATTSFAPEVHAVLSEGYLAFTSLVQSDPPDHTRIRNVFNKALSPTRVAAMEPSIRKVANELIDAFVNEGEGDLMSRFAYPLPGIVISDLLGIPRSDVTMLKAWSNDKQVLLAANEATPRLVEAARGYVSLQRYFLEHFEDRARAPKDDLITLLLPKEMGGNAALSVQEAVCNAMDILAAGHETTSDLIGNGLVLFIEHPDQAAEVRADASLIPTAVDEILRTDTPIRGMFRVTKTDYEIGGATIPAGAKVFVLYGSGNRDEARFRDPDRFDIHRKDDGIHIAFGKGIHYCVGNALARLEARVAFELLLERLPNVRRHPSLQAERRPYLILRGFERLPLAWDVPARA